MAAGSPLEGRMVFVVGAPRSGTMWLQRMLTVHPDVIDLPSETHLFSLGISHLRDRTQRTLVESPSTATWFMPQQEFAAAARAFADAAFGSVVRRTQPDAKRIIERSPTHVWHLGLIAEVYPDAYVLHIVRDGRDVVRSQVAQNWGAADIGQAAAEWGSSIRSARAARPRVPRYLEVRYEELLTRPDQIVGLLDFIGLPAGPDVIDQALIEGGLAVNVDPMRPDVATGKWRTEWSADDVAAFEDAAGDALDLLGYPRLPSLLGSPRPDRAARSRRRRPALPTRRAPKSFSPVPERMQVLVTDLVAALSGEALEQLTPLLQGAAVEVKVSAGREVWRGLGHQAVARLQAWLEAEGAWGEPLRGEQVIGRGTWTVLLAHRGTDGSVVDRVLVISVNGDPAVTSLRYYRLPFTPPGG